MAFDKSMTGGVPSDNAINSHYRSLLKQSLDSMDSDGEDVKEIPHDKPTSGQNPKGPMKSNLMTFTQMLEAMEDITNSISDPSNEKSIEDEEIHSDGEPGCDEKELLAELNDLFTPVLVMQNYEKDIASQVNSAVSEAAVLTERNIISFDDETRMSQLIDVCAKLIAKKKNTKMWQIWKQAAIVKKQAAVGIQKEEYDEAKSLAQKYLVMVSTTNNSSVARDAATDLLPQTQH